MEELILNLTQKIALLEERVALIEKEGLKLKLDVEKIEENGGMKR